MAYALGRKGKQLSLNTFVTSSIHCYRAGRWCIMCELFVLSAISKMNEFEKKTRRRHGDGFQNDRNVRPCRLHNLRKFAFNGFEQLGGRFGFRRKT